MKLHTAGEDYLEAVFILQKKLGMVRSVDVARYMEVSKPSVCYAVGTLREGGFLTTDFFVDVTEEVMETIRAAERAEAAYERKMYRYKAQYSLDCENGIENAVLLKPQTPEIVLEEKQFQEQVYAAVMRLPEKQAKRIYETRFLAVGKTDMSPPISEST